MQTVQIKPKEEQRDGATPEWRKRLIRGEIVGEQRDLFAPIGLESIFKPPSPRETAQHEAIPIPKQGESFWTIPDYDNRTAHSRGASQKKIQTSDSPAENKAAVETGKGNAKIPKDLTHPTHSERRNLDSVSLKSTSSRTVSSVGSTSRLEDLRNEGITPIYVSLTPASQSSTRTNGGVLLQSPNEGYDILLHYGEQDVTNQSLLPDGMQDVTSQSLPRDLSMGTLDSGDRNLLPSYRSGEYLGEGSLRRNQSATFSSTSQWPASALNSRIRSSPPYYYESPRNSNASPLSRPSSSHTRVSENGSPGVNNTTRKPFGSPLKLFGNHDTFTNNRLLRRMSQFEESLSDVDNEQVPVSPSDDVKRRGATRSHHGSEQRSRNYSLTRSDRPHSRSTRRPRIGNFGDGQLDGYNFSNAGPYEPMFPNYEKYEESHSYTPAGQSLPAGRRSRSVPHSGSQKTNISASGSDRRSRSDSAETTRWSPRNRQHSNEEYLDYPDGKRIPRSPAKDQAPKRRRTLTRLESPHLQFDVLSSQADGDVSLLKRSLMHHGMADNEANSPVQSTRQLGVVSVNKAKSSTRNGNRLPKDHALDVNEHADAEHSTQRQEVPELKVTGANDETGRGSITTQDFINEATRVMDLIRANGRTAGGLPSVGESGLESENYDDDNNDGDESTEEAFTRPPSREGVITPKQKLAQAPNARVLSHLMKFQENDDQEFGVSASVTSLHLDRNFDDNAKSKGGASEAARVTEDNSAWAEQHMGRKSGQGRKRGHSVLNKDQDTIGSQTYARSVPTGSSESSQAKGVLPSTVLSRLIPKEVNGLTYDRSRNQWIKGHAQKPRYSIDRQKTDESEEDPFKDISDLSVDESKELKTMQTLNSPAKSEKSTPREKPDSKDTGDNLTKERFLNEKSRSSPPLQNSNGSSLQSKATTRFTNSIPNTDTRVTSWSADGLGAKEHTESVEHEIELHEGRISQPPNSENSSTKQPRAVTVSFSSPLVSHSVHIGNPTTSVQEGNRSYFDSDGFLKDDLPCAPETPESSLVIPSTEIPSTEAQIDETSRGHFGHQNETEAGNFGDCTTVRHADDGKSYPFELDSLSEFTVNQVDPSVHAESGHVCQRTHPTGLSQIQGTVMRDNALAPFPDGRSIGFELSTLSDFTVHQVDHAEASYVDRRSHPTALRQVHGRFAQATENLVKHITDAEPHGLFWEDLRRLTLRSKGLKSLHKLCDFCPVLEDLDVTDNDIEHLDGVPTSLRTLTVQHNKISSMTAWGHLGNLQYLDISCNGLENLNSFSGLVHLRELKANDNLIQNIDGIMELNGLLSLDLSNNPLSAVHFEKSEL